jgi:hypothetical protein
VFSVTRYIGIDPGPTPGVAVLEVSSRYVWELDVLQCTARLLLPVALELARGREDVRVAIERFVARGRASAEQRLTADQVVAVQQTLNVVARVSVRSASEVKCWATDARLAACRPPEGPSLLELCKGMRHARDAARHALFAAVRDGAIPDPLSRGASS